MVASLGAETEATSMVYEAIDEALTPWRSGIVTVYRKDFLEFVAGPKFQIEIELLPDLPFEFVPDFFLDPVEMMFLIADKAFKFYRNRPALPVDDHIVLGED